METIGSKRSYALIWCMPNNDDDDNFELAGGPFKLTKTYNLSSSLTKINY